MTSYSDIASVIQAKLNAESEPQFASCYVTFNAMDSAFLISGGVQEKAQISVNNSPLADALGLSQGQTSEGNASQTALEAFMVAEAISDSFGSATFLTELSIEQSVELAEYVAGENVKYQLYLSVPDQQAEMYSKALMNTASTGLNLKTEENFLCKRCLWRLWQQQILSVLMPPQITCIDNLVLHSHRKLPQIWWPIA